MVWFQCEDCGENLKKPKLPNHFRICSASKLSCIDCGEIFGQQSVQGHTQCISEAEKYGPKSQGKVSNGGATPKSNKDSKQQPDIDINVGLSGRPPWFCSLFSGEGRKQCGRISDCEVPLFGRLDMKIRRKRKEAPYLCNTKATSRQTLLLHADGKKHRAKARAHHAAKQQPKEMEEAPDMKVSSENTSIGYLANNKHVEEPKVQDLPKNETGHINPETVNRNLPSSKKRKQRASENDGTRKEARTDASGEASDGEVIQAEEAKADEAERSSAKAKSSVLKEDNVAGCISTKTNGDTKTKIKWKKLITLVLRSDSDGVLKLKKLRKLVLKTLLESGVQEDKTQLIDMLDHKINSSSKFTVDGKYVRLVAKD